MNIALVRGTLSKAPERRQLPSGDQLLSLEVTVRRPGERAESVPVSWPDPPGTGLPAGAGDEVVVVGRVRRRFYRQGGATRSRTEVVAERVVPARQRRRAAALVARAVAALEHG